MTKFEHSDMKQAKETPASMNVEKPQTYIVDDPTRPMGTAQPTIDDRLAQFAARPEAPAGSSGSEYRIPQKKKLSGALEKLIFIGRVSKELVLHDVTFEISTLTSKEHNDIVHMMYSFTEAADLFTVRLITLANALRSIDGVPLGDIEIDGEFESDLHRRMSIVDHLQLSLVEKLYDEYEGLSGEVKELNDDTEEVKNS